MRYGGGEFDVSHSLAAHLGAGDFHAALFADDAFIADPFIFAAMAFPVLGRSEDLFAEKSVFFGFLRAVVDRFGFGDFAVGPFSYLFGRRNSDLYRVKIV